MTGRPNPPGVLCAGILVADLFVPPLSALPEQGALVATGDFLLDSGGCAANVATSLARLGVRAAVAGRVGEDVFGDFIAADLRRKHVETAGILRSMTNGTSKTVILTVTGEDRRFIHTFGANADFTASDVDIAALADGDVLYVGGYLVMPGMDPGELAAALRAARARGVRTVLDVVVPAGGGRTAIPSLTAVLPGVDFFMPNEEEARALTGDADLHRQAEQFLAAGCGTVVITRGSQGTFLMDAREVVEAGVYPVEFVDGSGAGDAFAAGFIAGLLEGRDTVDTLRFAGAVGASACTRLGCTTGVFDRAQAEAYVREHPLEVRVLSPGG